MRIQTPITTAVLEALHIVPVADVVDNAYLRDVIGNKADASSSSAASNVLSLVARSKGVFISLSTPATDSVNNGSMRDVVGSKDDTEQPTLVDTASLMRYQKALIQELSQRGTPAGNFAGTTSNSLQDVVNITDKGVLTGIVQHSQGADRGYLNIVIDGVTFWGTSVFAYNSQTQALAFNHRFNTSLHVRHSNNGGAVTIETYVSYTTD